MLISFVLRLAPAALAVGQLAGEVEHVPSGERAWFRDAGELGSWCAGFTAGDPLLLPRTGAPDLPNDTPES